MFTFRFALILWLSGSLLGQGNNVPKTSSSHTTHKTTLGVDTIIQRSVQANQRDWAAVSQYDCSERDRTRDGTKTYKNTMIFGSPYQQLVERDGKPLPPEQAAEEKRKLEQAISERKSESPEKRAQRIAKYDEERKRDQSMMDEMVKAFQFKPLGETQLDGHAVYMLQATPRPGYRPPNMESQALTGMQGKLWIDKKTFQWVKVAARVMRPVAIKGFLAEVEPGTYFELEKIPVAPGIWLAKHFSMESHAKVLKMIPKNGQEDDTFFNYRRAKPSSQS